VITNLCLLEPDPVTSELTVTALHPGATRKQVQAECGWSLRFAPDLKEAAAPTAEELRVLRDLQARTAAAHRADS
jgi:glutaconate CoA-transferase subunit B